MGEHSRYSVTGGEDGSVLKNKPGIIDRKDLDDTETLMLSDTYTHFLDLLEKGRLDFDVKLIFEIHRYFLKTLYEWAGSTRTVEISKGGMLFCPHSQIKKQLGEFGGILKENIPSPVDDKKAVSQKLAVIHCELNAIHPFREGNGRTIRVFLDLLAKNVGYNPINYSKSSPSTYVKACIAGMGKDYSGMQKIIFRGL